jgi:cytochrome c553
MKIASIRGLNVAALLALWLLTAVPAWAAPDAATREAATKLAVNFCGQCHGPEGRGDNPRIPRLAGQQRAYIEVQLKAFRSQTRADHAAHETMWGIAALLNDDLVGALAEHFAAQAPAPGIEPSDKDAAARGKLLFEKGSPERRLAPCASCHGQQAEGLVIFPRLAGQHGQYLFIQLQSMRNKLRNAPVMHGLIKDLTDSEIVALAAFLESK